MTKGKRLKVAMRLHAFPNLSETFIYNQIVFLLNKNVEIHVFVNEVKWSNANLALVYPNLYIHKIKYRPFSLSYFKKVKYLKQILACNIKSLIVKNSLFITEAPDYVFDVYHCQFASFIKEASELRLNGRLKFKNLVSSGRGYDVSRDFLKRPEDFIPFFSELNLFLPVSESLAHNFNSNGFPGSKIEIHHSGIDMAKFQFNPHVRKSTILKLVTVCRLVEKKGLLESIQAVELLKSKGHKIKYEIYGDGELYPELLKYILEKKLSNEIELKGARPNSFVLEAISNSNFFILHSKTARDGNAEGIPNVLKEAMALGVLPITTLHGGIPELFPDEYKMYLSAEGDVAAMADNIEKLNSLDAAETQKLLLLNRRKIETDFDISKLTDSLYQHYLSLVEN